jgi:hypothetical protein
MIDLAFIASFLWSKRGLLASTAAGTACLDGPPESWAYDLIR